MSFLSINKNRLSDLFNRRRTTSSLIIDNSPAERQDTAVLRHDFADLTTASTSTTTSVPVSSQKTLPRLIPLPLEGSPINRSAAIKRGLNALKSQRNNKKKYQDNNLAGNYYFNKDFYDHDDIRVSR